MNNLNFNLIRQFYGHCIKNGQSLCDCPFFPPFRLQEGFDTPPVAGLNQFLFKIQVEIRRLPTFGYDIDVLGACKCQPVICRTE